MGNSPCTSGGTVGNEAEDVVACGSAGRATSTQSVTTVAETGAEPVEEILHDLQQSISLVLSQYQRIIRHPKVDPESEQQADEAVKRLQKQLRRTRLRTTQTCPAGAEAWLEMNMGGHTRTRTLREVVQKVQMESRIIRRWRHKCSMLSSHITVRSAPKRVPVEIDRWDGLDVFQLEQECQQPLTQVFMSIWRSRDLGLLSKSCDEEVVDIVRTVEKTYKNLPYHNRMHAAEVTLAAYHLWSRAAAQEGMRDYFTEVDLLVMVVAAAVHDVAHPGVSNDFLVKTHDDLAIQYSDRSVLESFHAATAFSLMKERKINLLEHKLPSPPAEAVKARVVDMILATDMAGHKALIDSMAAEVAGHANPQDIDKLVLERGLLHLADIGHPLRPRHCHEAWTRRVREEFLAQGDRELALGLQPAPLFDRRRAPSLARGQLGFLEFVVQPAWQPLRQLLGPAAAPLEACLRENQRAWEELAAKESAAESAKKPPPSPCRARTIQI